MPRSTRLIALGAASVLAACSERTGPTPDPQSRQPAEAASRPGAPARAPRSPRAARAPARPRAGRPGLPRPGRSASWTALPFASTSCTCSASSPAPTAGAAETSPASAGSRRRPWTRTSRGAAALEFYLPVPEHRRGVEGDDANILVATAQRGPRGAGRLHHGRQSARPRSGEAAEHVRCWPSCRWRRISTTRPAGDSPSGREHRRGEQLRPPGCT